MISHPLIAWDRWKEAPRLSGIYRITHLLTGLEYIGSANDIRHRLGKHRRDLLRGKHHSTRLSRTFHKYGYNSIAFQVIELVEPSCLLIREQHYIDSRNPKFNSAPVAGSCAGVKHSRETLRKRSAATIAVWAAKGTDDRDEWSRQSSEQMKQWWSRATPAQREEKAKTASATEMARIASMPDADRRAHLASLKARAKRGGAMRAQSITKADTDRMLAGQMAWRASNPSAVGAASMAMRETKRKSGKLNPETVRQIRLHRSFGYSIAAIALEFGVSSGLVHGIIHGTKWGDIQ